MTRAKSCLAGLLVIVTAACAQAPVGDPQQATAGSAPRPLRSPDVIYVPTPPDVVDAMLLAARVGRDDVLYDLGSGDGRIPIAAAKDYGVQRSVGIDINPARVAEANANRIRAGVADRVTFRNADLYESDFSEATVVTLYLMPALNLKLLPKLLKELKPGSRVVSHAFDMGSWRPDQVLNVRGYSVFLWTIPAPGSPSYAAAMAAAQGN